MAKQSVKFIKSEIIAEGTMAFHFEKPANFEYKAGQTLDLTLTNPPETDAAGNMRAFSIASAPHEAALMIATRMRDTAFKRSIAKLASGAPLEIEGPFGSFTLPNDTKRPAVFLTGGIGVTPIRAILLDAKQRHLPHRIYVFYSNRRPEDAAFLSELTDIAKELPTATFVPTMTDMSKSKQSWNGATGYVTKEMILKEIPDVSNAIFYLAGPATMVAAMRTILTGMQVDDDAIRTEEFSGY